MTTIPKELRYTNDHEWVRAEGDAWAVGITAFATNQLGDIVLVQLPKVGDEVDAGGSFGTIESVKSVSELYAPVSGKVVRINEDLDRAPELVNEDPYSAWMVEIAPSDASQGDKLLTAEQYEKHIAEAE